MCYNVKATLETQLKHARRKGHTQEADAIQLELNLLGKGNYNVANGFDYPPMVIYPTPDSKPLIGNWGFVPRTFKGEDPKEFLTKFRTLNATIERLFDSYAFQKSAKSNHCLLYVDGYYDYHHHQGVKYPFFIHRSDVDVFPLAGIWDEWINPITNIKLISFSIVTTVPNKTMALIHNNPDREGPRMPVVLDEIMAEEWLKPGHTKNSIMQFSVPFTDSLMDAYPVKPLSGKNVIKNAPDASDKVEYKDLSPMIEKLNSYT